MSYDIKEQLSALRENDQINPDRAWVSKQRGLLLDQIKGATETHESVDLGMFGKVKSGFGQFGNMFIPQGLPRVMRPVMTVILVIGLAVGGWAATVSASYNSLPGDRLYRVKLATEKVQDAVTNISISDEESIKKDLKRAQRRSEEILEAVKKVKEKPKNKPKVTEAIKEVALTDLESSVQSAEMTLSNIAEEEVVDAAKVLSEETDKIREILDDVKGEDEVEEEVIDVVGEATKVVEEAGINAVATAVDKKGEEEEVKELVIEMMGKKIEALLESADELKEINQELENLEIEDESIFENIEDLSSEITEESSTSTVSTAEDAGEVAEDLAEEADQLFEENKLTEIMSVVREVTQSTNETDAVVVEVKKVVADVVARSEETIAEQDAKEVVGSDGQSTTGTVDVVRD